MGCFYLSIAARLGEVFHDVSLSFIAGLLTSLTTWRRTADMQLPIHGKVMRMAESRRRPGADSQDVKPKKASSYSRRLSWVSIQKQEEQPSALSTASAVSPKSVLTRRLAVLINRLLSVYTKYSQALYDMVASHYILSSL